jgi:glycosyltransferase involved in cell wall biosynthesis
MRVSIVIPCYNHAHYLSDAITSAIEQTRACQIVVVDDGSADGSGAVARRYAGVKVVRQENRGLAAARNCGVRESDGEVVIFLDADDRLWRDAAHVAVDLLSANPQAAMVVGRCRVVDSAGVPQQTNPVRDRACSYEELLRDNAIWTPAMAAFRRSALQRVGEFDETNSPAADYDLYLRVAREYPIVAHAATVVDYRQHRDNMSRDHVMMLEATLKVLRAQESHAKGDATRHAAYREGLINCRACYGERLVDRFRGALRERRYRDACVDAAHLLRLYPSGVRQHLMKKLAVMTGGSSDPPDGAADVART